MTSAEDQIWVKLTRSHKWTQYGNRCLVTFENDRIVVTNVGLIPVRWDIKPKEVIRKDPITIKVNTGFWNLGWLVPTFDSAQNTDE